MKYLISPITEYDEWNMLWETKIAQNDKNQTLILSVWGKTEQASRDLAKKVTESLSV